MVAVAYAGTSCYKKRAISNAIANDGVRGACLGTSREPPKTITCPSVAGQTYTKNGATYTIKCGVDYLGGDLTSQATDSFEDCIAACDNNPKCIDVSFNYGSCYLKDTLTTLVPNPHVWTAESDRKPTTPITPTTPGDSFACAEGASIPYTTAGKSFTVSCGTVFFSGDFLALNTDTMTRCIDACASHAECGALSYRGTGCYLKSTASGPVTDAGVRGAAIVRRSCGRRRAVLACPRTTRARNLWASEGASSEAGPSLEADFGGDEEEGTDNEPYLYTDKDVDREGAE